MVDHKLNHVRLPLNDVFPFGNERELNRWLLFCNRIGASERGGHRAHPLALSDPKWLKDNKETDEGHEKVTDHESFWNLFSNISIK